MILLPQIGVIEVIIRNKFTGRKRLYRSYEIVESKHYIELKNVDTPGYKTFPKFMYEMERVKKKTNAEKIREMSNAELAEFLNNIVKDFDMLYVCIGGENDIPISDNYADIIKWLESEGKK